MTGVMLGRRGRVDRARGTYAFTCCRDHWCTGDHKRERDRNPTPRH